MTKRTVEIDETRTRRIHNALMLEGSQKIDELINERDHLKAGDSFCC